MNNETQEKIALFRYGTIAPFIQRQTIEKRPYSYFSSLKDKQYVYIDGNMITISPTTLARWYKAYKASGFDGLKPNARSDVGKNRKLNGELISDISFMVDQYPRLPATQIYEKLINNGQIVGKSPSLSTVTRFVSNYKKEKRLKPMIERRRYEKEHINEVWCGDSSHGPYISVDKEKKKTYIIALIDDASRMIVGIDVFFEDNFVNLMKVIKSAVSKYGKPKVFNFDNGSNYKCKQMELLAARIGCAISYCHPFSPQEKAKIERWFRTLKENWMSLIKSNDFHSLDELRLSLFKYVQEYNLRVHSSLGLSPQDRFFKESELIIRLSDTELERDFLLEVERKVSADGVVVIDDKEYEVDYHYQNQRLMLRYSPDLSKIYVVDKYDHSLSEIKLLDKVSNSNIKRNKVRFSTKEEE